VWPFITGRVALKGPLAGLDFLDHFLGDPPAPRISGGGGTADLAVDVKAGHGTGRLTTESRRVQARYVKADIAADVSARVRIRDWDFVHDRIDIGGTEIDLAHASAVEAGPDSRDWWGHFVLPSAQIRSGRPDAFAASVSLRCRDARPLFTLFQIGLPGWIRGLLKLEGIEAHGKIGLGSRYTDVEGLEAAGGAFRIHGFYRERATARNGAFLIESGSLAAGLDIEGPASKLKLTGARKWFEERQAEKPENGRR
jgi:hypothetical protein